MERTRVAALTFSAIFLSSLAFAQSHNDRGMNRSSSGSSHSSGSVPHSSGSWGGSPSHGSSGWGHASSGGNGGSVMSRGSSPWGHSSQSYTGRDTITRDHTQTTRSYDGGHYGFGAYTRTRTQGDTNRSSSGDSYLTRKEQSSKPQTWGGGWTGYRAPQQVTGRVWDPNRHQVVTSGHATIDGRISRGRTTTTHNLNGTRSVGIVGTGGFGGERWAGGGSGVGLPWRVQRIEGIHVANSGFGNGFRCGYWQYNPFWCDSNFFFGFYSFTPYEPCVLSPWYWYPVLPPYIAYDSVFVIGGTYCPWGYGANYYYRPNYNYESYGDSDLNYAIDSLTNAFRQSDDSALEQLCPPENDVAIYADGQYMYSLRGEDFYRMMQDNIHACRTERYSVTSVRTDGSSAQITARHDFEGQDGERTTVYQQIRLRRDGGGYHITDFMTGRTPFRSNRYF